MTAEASRAWCAGGSRRCSASVGDVGVENNVAYFLLGDALDEPRFLMDCVRARGCHLLLDLHNVYTMAHELRLRSRRLPARGSISRKVIEIHVSGGSESAIRAGCRRGACEPTSATGHATHALEAPPS